ncbi:hypothetical protein LXA43DRAFT_886701 [Ganoderma leucocontextum]|nr:hypothetical protein LXA43DRAFT_886701 [Ganoderma leucocontextum]
MDPGHTSPITPLSLSALLRLDVRPPHDGPHDCLQVLSVLSDATLAPHIPGMPDDPVTEDETPPSGRLPPSSLPASQISEFSLTANHVDVASISDTEHYGPCEDTGTFGLGSSRAGGSAVDAQAQVATDMLALDSYGTSKGPCLIPGTSVDEYMALWLPASSPPSSSPPGLFSSPAGSPSGSPPSSSPVEASCDVEDHLPTLATQGAAPCSQGSPLKQALEVDESSDTAVISGLECRPLKRMKTELSPQTSLLNLTRPTQASQAKQHTKLTAPFRSPVIKGPLVHGGLHAVYASGRPAPPAPASKPPTEENVTEANSMVESNIGVHVANRDRSARAAKQFKPPMQVTNPIASSESGPAITAGRVSRVGAVPTIQALQGQVQTLKQAIKIKNSGNGDDDEVLEQLVEKWTAVGREVAWALWDHVKDLDPGTDAPQQGRWHAGDEDDGAGSKRGFNPGWGYDGEPGRKKVRMDEDVEQEEPPVVQHTIGVMLRRLGIDPDTLGWNEDEGDFVDV